jgi:hypothetical protein
MSRHPKSRDRVDKPPHQRRRHQPRSVRHTLNTQFEHKEDWVASPLLTAMDNMERHVQEMLDCDQHLAQTVPSTSKPVFDSAEVKALIVREVKRRVEEKLEDIVDTAIVARIRRLEASQKDNQSCMDKLQAVRKHDEQTVHDLDVLHRHEHTLNTVLVERLFDAPSPKGNPETRFSDTTSGLEGTDSVNSMLVSHVEALVMKVQTLEREVKWLQDAIERKGN